MLYLLFQRYSQCQAGHKMTVSMRVGGNFNFLPRSTVGKHISWADLWLFPVNDPNGVWGLGRGVEAGGGGSNSFSEADLPAIIWGFVFNRLLVRCIDLLRVCAAPVFLVARFVHRSVFR